MDIVVIQGVPKKAGLFSIGRNSCFLATLYLMWNLVDLYFPLVVVISSVAADICRLGQKQSSVFGPPCRYSSLLWLWRLRASLTTVYKYRVMPFGTSVYELVMMHVLCFVGVIIKTAMQCRLCFGDGTSFQSLSSVLRRVTTCFDNLENLCMWQWPGT